VSLAHTDFEAHRCPFWRSLLGESDANVAVLTGSGASTGPGLNLVALDPNQMVLSSHASVAMQVSALPAASVADLFGQSIGAVAPQLNLNSSVYLVEASTTVTLWVDGVGRAGTAYGLNTCDLGGTFQWTEEGQAIQITCNAVNVCPTEPLHFSALDACTYLLSRRASRLTDRLIDALSRQLRALLSDEDDLQEAGITVSVASFNDLVDFLATDSNRAHPSLSLTRDGHFAASWSPVARAKLTLVFKGSGHGEWLAVSLDASSPSPGSGTFSLPAAQGIPPQFKEWMVA
jgi:hypothetical protein